MKVQLRLKITCATSQFAKAVCTALRPDNVAFPPGLSMKISVRGQVLEISFMSAARLETLLSTVDEVLSDIQTSKETLEKTV